MFIKFTIYFILIFTQLYFKGKNMINIIDSIMGSGKTTFMINYMKENPDKRFFVVTPFLEEIERIIKEVSFLKEPEKSSNSTKYQDLQKFELVQLNLPDIPHSRPPTEFGSLVQGMSKILR